ncbi:MAG: hypothetical protein JWR22_1540 [Herminiimonas sp.]|nr:hypothetical protein [Herminiimonas sp.]
MFLQRIYHSPSFLTIYAVERRPLSLSNLSYGGPTQPAWLTIAVVDEIRLLEITRLAIGADKIAQRTATFVYGGSEYPTDCLRQPFISRESDPVRGCVGIDAGFEQAFGRVNISDADDDVSSEQHLLDGGRAVARLAIQEACGKFLFEGLDTELAQQCVVFNRAIAARMPKHCAEAARIGKSHDHRADNEIEMVMLVGGSLGRQYAKVARHAEVNDESAMLEVEQQIFSASPGASNRLANQLLLKIKWKWPTQTFMSLHHTGNDAALNMRRNAAPRHFNFWQFRHRETGSERNASQLQPHRQGASERGRTVDK